MPPTSPAAASNPMLGKAVVAVIGGGAAAVVFYALHTFRQTQGAMLIIAGGLVAVALLLVLYRLLLTWWRKRKAAPMTRSILANSSAAPHGVSDPAKRAKLDEMRKKFEEGVSKFRAAGKDLYTLPWLVLVGEPGGGKTEAIRHSQVGFPHGLQDYMQGAGGTVNMNWWFTNHAIILDTAGRLMFEEVAPGSTSEWNEFLSLLRQNRPNCPINGMVLVIPGDTLIKDSTEAIERKAGKIAQQLDLIQRTLDVRFPVFVVISKCDLISGFREYFENVDDPQLQGQIMGWSNPTSLDQPFNPEMVDEHLRTVCRRLDRRRYGLLLDPVHTEDPNGRRIDQVDALYTFPDALSRLGPRLRRYLEMIFVAGEWSPKPLFLRGIYFTSSMREGEALDAELAEVLKVPVDSIQGEGRAWERNKTFFLREPFLRKIFVEKGLVTRAARPNRLHRARKVAVLGFGFLAVLVLGGLTYKGNRDFNRSLGGENRFWRDVRDNHAGWAIVNKEGKYNNVSLKVAGADMTLNELFARASDHTQPINVPPVFKAAQAAARDLTPELRKRGYRAVYEKTVLAPLVDQARGKLSGMKPEAWTPDATAALKELIELEAAALAPAESASLPLDLDPLFKVALRNDAEFSQYQSMKPRGDLARSAERIYSPPPKADWARSLALLSTPKSTDEVVRAIEVFKLARKKKQDEAAVSAKVDELDKALEDYKSSVPSLAAAAANAGQIQTSARYRQVRGAIDGKLKDLAVAREEIAKLNGEARTGLAATEGLKSSYSDRAKKLNDESQGDFKALRDACGDHQRLLAALGDAPKFELSGAQLAKLERLDKALNPIDPKRYPGVPRYAAAEEVYRQAVVEMGVAMQPPLADAPDPLAAAAGDALPEELKAFQTLFAGDKELEDGGGVEAWKSTSRAATAYRRKLAIEAVLAQYERGIAAVVRERAKDRPRKHPVSIPFTAIVKDTPFAAEYDPDEAGRVLTSLRAVGDTVSGSAPQAPATALDVDDLRRSHATAQAAVSEYMTQYVDYWANKVPALASVDPKQLDTWDAFFKDHGNLNHVPILIAQQRVVEEVVSALEIAGALPTAARPARAATLRRAALAEVSELLDKEPFRKACDQVLRTWLRSQNNVTKLRDNILDSDPVDFSRDFIFQSVDPADFAGQYWTDLTVSLVRLLAGKSAQLNKQNLDQLVRQYNRFPLVLHTRDELSETQVDEARARVLQFVGGRWPDDPAPVRDGALIRDGNIKGVPKAAEESLKQLRAGLGNPRRFAALRQVFDALDPVNPASFTVHVLDRPTRDRLVQGLKYTGQHAEVPFRDIGMQQGTGKATYGTYDSRAPAPFELGWFKCRVEPPALPVVLTLGEQAVDLTRQRKVKVSFGGPWPVLRLLDGPGVKYAKPRPAVRKDGGVQQTWDVMLEVKDGNKVSAVWLAVTVDRELPQPADWDDPLQ